MCWEWKKNLNFQWKFCQLWDRLGSNGTPVCNHARGKYLAEVSLTLLYAHTSQLCHLQTGREKKNLDSRNRAWMSETVHMTECMWGEFLVVYWDVSLAPTLPILTGWLHVVAWQSLWIHHHCVHFMNKKKMKTFQEIPSSSLECWKYWILSRNCGDYLRHITHTFIV